jgi:hypothetical protein
MALFRRRERTRPYDEATAYARLHGDRDELVRIVELPPRRKRYGALLASGESIRRGFERRLDAREPDELPVLGGDGGLDPGLTQAVAVEGPEQRADDEQHDLVDGTGDGQHAEGGEPAQRPRDAAVAREDARGAHQPAS